MLVLDIRPAALSIEFVFDKKYDIEKNAKAAYSKFVGLFRVVLVKNWLHELQQLAPTK